MSLKSTKQIRRGAPEYFQWKSAIKSGVCMSSQASQELCSTPNPSHLTRYRSFQLTTLLSRISSTTHSSSPSMISGSGGGRGRRPGIGSSSARVSLTTLKIGCILLIEGGMLGNLTAALGNQTGRESNSSKTTETKRHGSKPLVSRVG